MNVRLYFIVLGVAAVHDFTKVASLPVTAHERSLVCDCKCCLIPHRINCKSYYVCIDQRAWYEECRDGLYFNALIESCDEAENVICPTPPPPPPEFECPSNEGLFRYEGDCSLFIQCSNRSPYVHYCPESLYFNEETGKCDYKQEVVCGPRMVTSSGFGRVTDTPIQEESLHSPECEEQYGFFPHLTNNNLYAACNNWTATIRQCPSNLIYDSANHTCRREQAVSSNSE